MKTKTKLKLSAMIASVTRHSRPLAICLLTSASCLAAQAQGTAFAYQGRLDADGAPVQGLYDLRFTIYDSVAAGATIGATFNTNAMPVSNGLFTVTLDFGAGVFTGPARWLEIAVRTNGGGAFTTLSPRQKLTATPYALLAGNVSGVIANSSLPSNPSFSGTVSASSFTGNGAGLSNVNAATLGGLTAAQFWQVGGNAGTTPGTHFLGTMDNQPLEVRVNNQRALRLQPGPQSPNVIGGSAFNSVSAGLEGVTIAGGGLPPFPNRVTNNYATIGGGTFNLAGGAWATVAGGRDNAAIGQHSTVGGGTRNTAGAENATVAGGVYNAARGFMTTVGGGWTNVIGTNSPFATIAGGAFNAILDGGSEATIGGGSFNRAAGYGATVPGGTGNEAHGAHSFAAGRQARAFHDGSFVWADSRGLGFNSTASNQFAVQASGGFFLEGHLGIGVSSPEAEVDVSADQATGRFVSYANANGSVLSLANFSTSPSYLGAINFEDGPFTTPGQIGYLANHSLVFRVGDVERMRLDASGLSVNEQPVLLAPAPDQPVEFEPNFASAWRLLPDYISPNIIGGYSGNIVSNGVIGAFIGGGGNSFSPNRVGGNYASVLGGADNVASGELSTAMGVGTAASGYTSTAMGFETLASGYISTAMGSQCAATNNDSTAMGRRTIAGGSASTAMGHDTRAIGFASTAMGSSSSATNNDSTAMGRLTLAGGSASTAMGYRARALHNGSFVWADQQEADFDSTAANQLSLRASGGVRLNNDTSLSFGNQTRQMLNLWNAEYGIGVQSDTTYFRSGNDFAWFKGGSHSDTAGNAGAGGSALMFLSRFGNLGLGTTNPGAQLEAVAAQSAILLRSTNSVNGAVLTLRNNTASPSYLGAINFETASQTPGQIGYLANDEMAFRVGGVQRMTLNASGLTVNGTFVSSSDRNA
ncbi:MAG: hypothetical protein KJ070_19645, partial [Verrucomicrobia bacterium]|nr:hypothetical protein [Verrucomicrobiota bacterium]